MRRVFLLPFLFATPALAQATNDNATLAATDAFGKQVGTEKSGLYNIDQVRGFNPVDAGNARLEGLYFDQVERMSSRLVSGNTIRVGASALSYPFPAPTGLVDYSLILARREAQFTVTVDNGSPGLAGFGTATLFELPLAGDRFGLGGGLGMRAMQRADGEWHRLWTGGLTATLRPAAGAELITLGSFYRYRGDTARPTLFPVDGVLPTSGFGVNLSQRWTPRHQNGHILGGIAKVPLGPVRLEAGLFHSGRDYKTIFADVMSGVRADGRVTARRIIADGDRRDASLSGEVRAVHAWRRGATDQRLILSLRGRDRQRNFGGSRSLALGPSSAISPDPRAPIVYALGPKSEDHVRQWTGGVAYSLIRRDRFSLDLGLSRTNYRKAVDFADPALPDPTARTNDWLWNVAGSWHATRRLMLYAGASRGIEEALIAPDIAINRAEPPPAILTRQVEAGLRYTLADRLNLVIGGFAIEKPYYNIDAALRYRALGTLSNRGVEVSLTGPIAPGVNLLAGLLLLDPRLSGEAVGSGAINRRPVGQSQRQISANLDWRLARGTSPWSFDVALDSSGRVRGNSAGNLFAPAYHGLTLGARYRFAVGKTRWLIRPQISNLLGTRRWNVSPSGGFTYGDGRIVHLALTVDF